MWQILLMFDSWGGKAQIRNQPGNLDNVVNVPYFLPGYVASGNQTFPHFQRIVPSIYSGFPSQPCSITGG